MKKQAGASLVALAVLAAVGATGALAHRGAGFCKPAILTQAEVAKAYGLPTKALEMSSAARSGVPQVPGGAVYTARERECDFDLHTAGHVGIGSGRASLFVFGSADDASAWFAAYTAHEKPACKTVEFAGADAACYEPGRAPSGAYPLFQAVQGQYVVWIHVIQKKLDLAQVEALATDVFAHAATA